MEYYDVLVWDETWKRWESVGKYRNEREAKFWAEQYKILHKVKIKKRKDKI